MKNASLSLAVLTAAGFLAAAPALAAPANLDSYGCRTEGSDYRCYTGSHSGQNFKSQSEMLAKTSTDINTNKAATGAAGNAASGPGVINNGSGGNRAGGGGVQNTPTTPGTHSGQGSY
jgi:hypothetical protein